MLVPTPDGTVRVAERNSAPDSRQEKDSPPRNACFPLMRPLLN